MKNNLKKIILLIFLLLTALSIVLSLLNLWQIKNLEERVDEERLTRLEYFSTDFSEIFKEELKKNMLDEIPLEAQERAQEIHQEYNNELKERSLKFSPDGTKRAYFQNKFVLDIKDIGNSDYVSLVVERENGESETVFRDNFHVLHFEWLNNQEIRVEKDCGSGCLLSYVVDISTKRVKKYFGDYELEN